MDQPGPFTRVANAYWTVRGCALLLALAAIPLVAVGSCVVWAARSTT